MEFTVDFDGKSGNRVCYINCDMGYDAVIEARKIIPNIPIENIRTECLYSRGNIQIKLTEDQVKRAMVFKNCSHIDVICEKNILNPFITKEIKVDEDEIYVTKKNFFGKKYRTKENQKFVYISYTINKDKLIDDWISNGCPCVMGNVEDPFEEEAKERAKIVEEATRVLEMN